MTLGNPREGVLAGRAAIITGAAGDLGAAIGRRFLAAGASVALLDRDAGALRARRDALAREHADADHRLFDFACDVADAAAAREAVDEAARRLGGLRILVNNAAVVTGKAPIGDMPVEAWRQALEVNVTGAFLMSKWAIPHLRAAGGGVVLNIASQLGHVTSPGTGAYGASKAALLSLTRSLAVDHAAEGIRAVSLSPGALMTGRLVTRYGSEAAVNAALAAKHPLGRIGSPEEIAESALFLASDAAAFITGADLLADGGYTAV